MDEEFDHDADENCIVHATVRLELQLNWNLLREQKLWLLQHANNNTWQAEGLLGLLDYIQDTAVDSGAATEEEVFGYDDTNENA